VPQMMVTSADGTKLAARRSSRGSPLVLVHGATGDIDTFALIEGTLGERHTVWVYSRRGRGGSGDGPDYALQREVDDVLAVLAAAGEGAHLVGHSSTANSTWVEHVDPLVPFVHLELRSAPAPSRGDHQLARTIHR
jgi:pimeloyl-ACP methyl ester carboxylesterase